MVERQSEASVLGRMGEIIGLFSEQQPNITIDQVQQLLKTSDATTYRYLSALTEMGMLSRYSGSYTIGPKVMELNYLMVHHDPLLSSAQEVARELGRKAQCHVLLCKVFGNHIVQIFQARGPGLPDIRFVPGRSLPLFRGSQSRIILACMERRKLKKIFEAYEGDADRNRIGADWKSFNKAMGRNRKDGYYISREELDRNVVGISAPIFDANEDILASLVVAFTIDHAPKQTEQELIDLVIESAGRITLEIIGTNGS